MNAATTWLSRNVARFMGSDSKSTEAASAAKSGKAAAAVPRSTHERLEATLRRNGEAMSPRVMRRLLGELQEVVAPRVSEVEGGRRAEAIANWYAEATPEERRDLWVLMCEQFTPDAARVRNAQQKYEAAVGTPDAPQAEAQLRRVLTSRPAQRNISRPVRASNARTERPA